MRKFLPVLAVLVFLLSACAGKIPHQVVPDYDKRGVRLVAVLPIVYKGSVKEIPGLFRARLLDALYFKGYPKIPTAVIDEKLRAAFPDGEAPLKDRASARDLGNMLGVDAVLYTVIEDCSTSFFYLYATTHMAVRLELVSARTGDTLWSTRYEATDRIMDITPDRLKMKSCQVYEPVMDHIVEKVAATIPDGPDL